VDERGGIDGFSRDRGLPSLRGRVLVMSVALLFVAIALVWQGNHASDSSQERLINVTGEVELPGWYSIDNGEVGLALEASGAALNGLPVELLETRLDAGWGVSVVGGGLSFTPPVEPLAFSLPIDINNASSLALQAIPGVGESLSQAIVSERREGGAFSSVGDLTRVRGIGPVTVEAIAPFVEVLAEVDESSRGDIGSQ
jgi:competence ComEA-like helix-hairpin-helix protein